jgi:response regulator RpfG family c-di-GMP phosphodiesterase
VRWLTGHTADIWYAVGAARFYESERYDGRGSLGLAGALIPIESRVLAVADAWAKLTARGTLAMTQDAAVASLERHQPRFDPRVIEAARELTIRDAEIRRVPPATRAGRRLALLVGAR